jgi:hypothetical protein
MNGPNFVPLAKRCAYCDEPLRMTESHLEAHRAGDQFVCNEFCAQALREEAHLRRAS